PQLDRKAYLIGLRLAAARNFAGEVSDIKLQVAARQDGPQGPVAVDVHIDPSRLSLTRADDRRLGEVEIVVYCTDKNERLLGRVNQTMTLKLREQNYTMYLAQGVPYKATIPVHSAARYVKVTAYDCG